MLAEPRSARLLEKRPAPSCRRTVGTWAIEEEGYSQRRACGLLGIDPDARAALTSPNDPPARAIAAGPEWMAGKVVILDIDAMEAATSSSRRGPSCPPEAAHVGRFRAPGSPSPSPRPSR